MKPLQRFRYAVTAMAAVLIVACVEAPLETPGQEVEVVENSDCEIIRSLGFSTDGIVETEDSYIVEGDIVIEKSAIPGYTSKTRQEKYSITLSTSAVSNIRVYINPNVGASWRQAVLDAMEEWNDIDYCSIGFSLVSSNHQVEIRRDTNNSISGLIIAEGALPRSSGSPGSYVEIGSIGYPYDSYSASFKKYIMVHELGHIIGLVHTDWASSTNQSEIPGSHIVGTPNQDDPNNSVMDWQARLAWTRFSQGDLAAVQILYGTPIWSGSITGPAITSPSSPAIYTLNLGTNMINHSVKWYLNGVFSGSTLSFSPWPLSAGQSSLKAEIYYGGTKYYETSRYIEVVPNKIDGTISSYSLGNRMPFSYFQTSENGLTLWMPANELADIYPSFPSTITDYFTWQVTKATLGASFTKYSSGVWFARAGDEGSELDVTLNYNRSPYTGSSALTYGIKIWGTGSSYAVAFTGDSFVIPEKDVTKAPALAARLARPSELRYEISSGSAVAKVGVSVTSASPTAAKAGKVAPLASKQSASGSATPHGIDISALSPGKYTLTLYNGNEVVFSETFDKK